MRPWPNHRGVASSRPTWGAMHIVAYRGSSDYGVKPWLDANPSLGVQCPCEGSVIGLRGSAYPLRWLGAFYALASGSPLGPLLSAFCSDSCCARGAIMGNPLVGS